MIKKLSPNAWKSKCVWLIFHIKLLFLTYGLLLILAPESFAQTPDYSFSPVISPISGHHVDYILPVDLPLIKKVSFYLTGGDGGTAIIDSHEAKGGKGATVEVTFNVGTEGGNLLPGSTIRYMEGISGFDGVTNSVLWSGFAGGGGGGGSGIWYKPPGSSDFTLLAVAGGGGGGFMALSAGEPAPSTGLPGGIGQNGGNGRGTGKDGGTAGHGGGGSGTVAGGGGGAFSGGGKILSCGTTGGGGGAGGASGGLGGSDAGCTGTWASGGSGVGGGGAGFSAGGGGGGYSGGGAGLSGGGGGGGSFVAWNAVFSKITGNGTVTSGASDGKIYYKYIRNIVPIAKCRDVEIELDAEGKATLNLSLVNNGSLDPDGRINNMVLDRHDFTCADLGEQTVVLTVTDTDNAMASCTAKVQVLDKIKPQANCRNFTIQLDTRGKVSITATQVNNASADNCGIDTMFLDVYEFTCANIGTNSVVLTVVDSSGNQSTCTATVTVEDNVQPVAVCKDITIELDRKGKAAIVATDIDDGSADACGIATFEASKTSFTCADLGVKPVSLKVTDVNGNFATCDAKVTVIDPLAPVVRTQDVILVLDRNGEASVHPSMIDDGSTDNCSIVDMWLNGLTEYDCGDVGEHVVELNVEDQSGNVGTNEAVVTVQFYEPDFTNIHGATHGDTIHLVDCLPWPVENNDLVHFREMQHYGRITSHLYRAELPDNPPWSMYELWRYEYRFEDACYRSRMFTFYLALYDLAPPTFHSFPNDTIVATVADVPDVAEDVRILDVCQYVLWDTVVTIPVLARNKIDTLGFTRRWLARDPVGHESFRDQMIWLESGNRNRYGLITGRIADEDHIRDARFAGEAGTNGIPVSLFRIGESKDSLIWVDSWMTGDWQGAQGKYYFALEHPGQYRVRIDSAICLVDTLKFNQYLWSDTLLIVAGEVNDQGWIITHPCGPGDIVAPDTFPTLTQEATGSDPTVVIGGLIASSEMIEWTIYPNPTTGYIHISIQSDRPFGFRIFDGLGRLVHNGHFSQGQSIDFRTLRSGLYHVQLIDRDEILDTKKVLVLE